MSEKITWTNEKRKLSQLIPWPRNPRQIKGVEVKRLQESLAEFGQVEPVAIGPGNELYNGHQRLKSWAAKYGDIEIDVRVASRPLTEKEREKLTVFLHKGAVGEWDFDKLANEFELPDLLEWGFDEKELLGVFPDEPTGEDHGAQIDKADELRQKWGVETGQLWKLGEHRLICGDCTDAEVIKRLLGDEKISIVVTDPPYNIGYEYDEYDDNKSPEEYQEIASGWYLSMKSVCQTIIVTPGRQNLSNWLGFDFCNLGCWVKPNAHGGAAIAHFAKWEPILFYGKHKRERDCDVFEFHVDNGFLNDKSAVGHSCPKPERLWINLLENYSEKLALVYEPFSGSGTTLIACERLSRKCRAVEISPAYCAVAIQRWVDMTGGTPELVRIDKS